MEIFGINIEDDRLKEIKDIIENCYKLNIKLPEGLDEKVRELGYEIDLEAGGRENPIVYRIIPRDYERTYFNLCNEDIEEGLDINLDSIPKNVKTIRIPFI